MSTTKSNRTLSSGSAISPKPDMSHEESSTSGPSSTCAPTTYVVTVSHFFAGIGAWSYALRLAGVA
jgi:hypothetical protein